MGIGQAVIKMCATVQADLGCAKTPVSVAVHGVPGDRLPFGLSAHGSPWQFLAVALAFS